MSLDRIKEQLHGSSVKQRREAVKALASQLDSPHFLNQLDVNTEKLWPQDKLTQATWPGLVDLYLSYVTREVLDNNKQLDTTAAKVLRRVFQEADNSDRCGPGCCHLLRRAGFAFDKMQKILERSEPGQGFITSTGKEFVNILLKVLLPNEQYCHRSSVSTFQGLLEEVMCRFEALREVIDHHKTEAAAKSASAAAAGRYAVSGSSSAVAAANREVLAAEAEALQMATLMSGLLAGLPGQLAVPFASDLLAFLAASLKWLQSGERPFGRLDVQLLSSVNGLLLSYGPDLRPAVATCHKALHDYIKQAWGERNQKLKLPAAIAQECVLCYCRVSLALGGPQSLPGGHGLRDLMHLVNRHINSEGFGSWWVQSVLSAAAAAAVASGDDPKYRRSRALTSGDVDLDDDFDLPTSARPLSSPSVASGGTQHTQGFTGPAAGGLGSHMGPPPARSAAAAAASVAAVPLSCAVLLGGGLGGFAGQSSGGIGCHSSSIVLTPALVGVDYSTTLARAACVSDSGLGYSRGQLGLQQGLEFAGGGLGEGLAGLAGVEGAGLRVLAALSPACGADAAQGLLQLWRHVSGLAGGAPSEKLLEGLVETMAAAVCAGGWVQLGQLFGLMRGSHTLLAAQKVPLSTLHLLLRLLQQVAVAAPAAGLQLDVPRAAFYDVVSQVCQAAFNDVVSQVCQAVFNDVVSQGSSEGLDVMAAEATLLGEMLAVHRDVLARLNRLRAHGKHIPDHNPLPQSTQLQLRLTAAALLHLQPRLAYHSSGNGNSGPADMVADVASEAEAVRVELLGLMCCSSQVLRIKSGRIVCQLVSDAAAAAAAVKKAALQQAPAAAGSGSVDGEQLSIPAAVAAAVEDIQQYMLLLVSSQLSAVQGQYLEALKQQQQQQPPGGPAADKTATLTEQLASRCLVESQQLLSGWEAAVVQLVDLMSAAAVTAPAALNFQEPPNTLESLLLGLLGCHAAVVQQLPAEVLPATSSLSGRVKRVAAVLGNVTINSLTLVDKTTLMTAIFIKSLPALGSLVPFRPPQVELQEWNRAAAASLPYVTQAVVRGACEQVAKNIAVPAAPGKPSAAAQGQSTLQQIGLVGAGLQALLLNIHRHLVAAALPVHRLQRLAQVEAMLHILREDEASAPLVARYLCSMLLQHLCNPALQPTVCSFLEIIFAQDAAAARTQQQQALLWFSPSKTAVTLAAGGGLGGGPVDLPDTFPAVHLLKVLLRPAKPELLQAVDMLPPFAAVLKHLAECLFDSQPLVVAVAQATLSQSGTDLPGVGSLGLAAQLGAAVTEGLCLSSSTAGNAALHRKDLEGFTATVAQACHDCVLQLARSSTQSAAAVNPLLVQLRMLHMLRQGGGMQWPPSRGLVTAEAGGADAFHAASTQQQTPEALLKQLLGPDYLPGGSSAAVEQLCPAQFQLCDQLLALQSAMTKVLGRPDALVLTLQVHARAAMKADQVNFAAAALSQLQQLLREASMAAASGVETAGEGGTGKPVPAWLSGVVQPDSEVILTLNEAAKLAEQQLQQEMTAAYTDSTARLHCDVFYQLAAYADQHYRELDSQMASPEWQKQLKVLESKRQSVQEVLEVERVLRRLPPQKQAQANVQLQLRQLVMKRANLERTINLDSAIVQQQVDHHRHCLQIALLNYRRSIVAADRHDLQVVYRLCSLWFQHGADDVVNEALAEVFQSVASAKFVPLDVMSFALTKLATEHPYHTLYSLIALKNGSSGKDVNKPGAILEFQADLSKVQAAADLLQGLLANGSQQLKDIVQDMQDQVQVYIEIASLPIPRVAGTNQIAVKALTLPGGLRRRLLNIQHAPAICRPLDIDSSCSYTDIPRTTDIESTIDLVGGINSPLVLRTADSDGRRQRIVAKSGQDDLRQDAVMQQFFGLINALLASSATSRQRRLSIRTYRVVPCSPVVGVIEWVEGTMPLSDYLAAGERRNGGACGRYRQPGQLTWFECYQKMMSQNNKPEQLTSIFEYVVSNFPAVLHHFFLERFSQPARWFEARTAYTRSTAVNSMAGFIIGLGDRHMGNILIDLTSAEVVHIDLGIAFEQGLFLQTPERVPFRLTQNVVDGMGAAGTEGTFRRCCETALQVLREHKEALLTVVQVVLHDPMYRWQMTTTRALRKQQDPMQPAPDIGNADAERAVLRVKQKLDGQDVEGGVALTVEAQVGLLLQTAQDPERLCRMYAGWAAWM
eukprot:gene4991-5233_t